MTQRCVSVICVCVCMCVKQRHVSPLKAAVLSGAERGSEAWKHSWHLADLYWTSPRSDTTYAWTKLSLSARAGSLNRWHATSWTWRPWRGCCHGNLSGNSILLWCCSCLKSSVCLLYWLADWLPRFLTVKDWQTWFFKSVYCLYFSIKVEQTMRAGGESDRVQINHRIRWRWKTQNEVWTGLSSVYFRSHFQIRFSLLLSRAKNCFTNLGNLPLYLLYTTVTWGYLAARMNVNICVWLIMSKGIMLNSLNTELYFWTWKARGWFSKDKWGTLTLWIPVILFVASWQNKASKT